MSDWVTAIQLPAWRSPELVTVGIGFLMACVGLVGMATSGTPGTFYLWQAVTTANISCAARIYAHVQMRLYERQKREYWEGVSLIAFWAIWPPVLFWLYAAYCGPIL